MQVALGKAVTQSYTGGTSPRYCREGPQRKPEICLASARYTRKRDSLPPSLKLWRTGKAQNSQRKPVQSDSPHPTAPSHERDFFEIGWLSLQPGSKFTFIPVNKDQQQLGWGDAFYSAALCDAAAAGRLCV